MINAKKLSTQEILHLLAKNSGMGGGNQYSKDEVKNIIRQAAVEFGVDPQLLTDIAMAESSLNPQAQNRESSAGGLFQFLEGENGWADVIAWSGGHFGGAEGRFDPKTSARAAAWLIANGWLSKWNESKSKWYSNNKQSADKYYSLPKRGLNYESPKIIKPEEYPFNSQSTTPSPTVTPAVSPTSTPRPTPAMFINGKPQGQPTTAYPQRVKNAWQDMKTPDPLFDPQGQGQQQLPRTKTQEVVDFLKVLFGGQPTRVTQAFGVVNPSVEKFTKGGVNTGTDYAAAIGTPVNLPAGNWKVVEAFTGDKGKGYIGNKTNRGYGNSILVQNADTGEKIRFSHLSDVFVTPGQVLKGGTVGKTGATGNVTGPHLDLEYYDSKGKLSNVSKATFYNATPRTTTPNVKSAPTLASASLQNRPNSVQRISSTPQIQSAVSQPYTSARSVPSPQAAQYKVQRGDTLSSIASRNNTTVSRLASANKIANPNLIKAGASLKIA